MLESLGVESPMFDYLEELKAQRQAPSASNKPQEKARRKVGRTVANPRVEDTHGMRDNREPSGPSSTPPKLASSAEQAQQMFDEFFQVHKIRMTAMSKSGAGMGEVNLTETDVSIIYIYNACTITEFL